MVAGIRLDLANGKSKEDDDNVSTWDPVRDHPVKMEHRVHETESGIAVRKIVPQ